MEAEEVQALLSSLVSDIKGYSGSDPLRPWLRGMKRLRTALPAQALQDKLPRFLQKCAERFQSEARYANDPRYVRVWIDLMDFVEDAKPLLKKMQKQQIGLRRASFYIAYALYYEKHRRLQDAEAMYHAGVQILAEPVSELQKSYDQFLHRLPLYNKRKKKSQMPANKETATAHPMPNLGEAASSNNVGHKKQDKSRPEKEKVKSRTVSTKTTASNNLSRYNSENTIMVRKFVDSAIVGKSVAEMSCHNGLVEPTITTKEAMHDINNMFQEPLDLHPTIRHRSHTNKANKTQTKENSGFQIFADEERTGTGHGLKEDTVMIRKFVGSAVSEEAKVENACHHGLVDPTMNLKEAMDAINGMFRKPMNMGDRPRRGGQKVSLGERKLAGTSFSILPDDDDDDDDEPGENMNPAHTPNTFPDSSFSILPDDESEENTNTTSKPYNVFKGEGGSCDGLFEPTFFTRQAMDDINELFGKEIDF